MPTIYSKGAPYHPPVVHGLTFACVDSVHDIWSATATTQQVTALCGPGFPFYTQAEIDRFQLDFDVLAEDAVLAATEDLHESKPHAHQIMDARNFGLHGTDAVPHFRWGKRNPFL